MKEDAGMVSPKVTWLPQQLSESSEMKKKYLFVTGWTFKKNIAQRDGMFVY